MGSSQQPRTALFIGCAHRTEAIDSHVNAAGFALNTVSVGESAGAIRKLDPCLVILEHAEDALPVESLVRTVRTAGVSHATPLLLYSATEISPDVRRQAYGAGVWEVFASPVDGEAFVSRLRTFSSGREVVEHLMAQSLIDEATQLYNRRGLETRSIEMAAQCARLGTLLGCVAVGVNVPGTADKPLTKEQLVAVGSELRRSGRSSDAIGRTGDAEFSVLAPGASSADVKQIAHRLTARIEHALLAEGIRCDTPWAGRLLQPSRDAVRLGGELLQDTLGALREVREHTEAPASS